MATWTDTETARTTTEGPTSPRSLAFGGALADTHGVSETHTRRTLAHTGAAAPAADSEIDHDRRRFLVEADDAHRPLVDLGHTRRRFVLHSDEEAHQQGTPILVPTAGFYAANVVVRNSEGEPLEHPPKWVAPREKFPTLAKVGDDGRARVYLVRGQAYDTWLCVAEADGDADATFYEASGTVTPDDRTEELRFQEVDLGGDNPLSAGFGASFGGS